MLCDQGQWHIFKCRLRKIRSAAHHSSDRPYARAYAVRSDRHCGLWPYDGLTLPNQGNPGGNWHLAPVVKKGSYAAAANPSLSPPIF